MTDYIEDFLFFCEKVLIQYSKIRANDNNVKSGLSNYKTVFDKTKGKDSHLNKFIEVFNQCRDKLLEVQDDNDNIEIVLDWIKSQDIIIETIKGGKSKIYISRILEYACEVSDDILDKMEVEPEKYKNSKLATYPETYLKYLFNIFTNCDSSSDARNLLKPYIDSLGKSNDIFSTISNVTGENINGNTIGEVFNQAANTPGLGDVINNIIGGLKDIDYNDSSSIGDKFGNIINDTVSGLNENGQLAIKE